MTVAGQSSRPRTGVMLWPVIQIPIPMEMMIVPSIDWTLMETRSGLNITGEPVVIAAIQSNRPQMGVILLPVIQSLILMAVVILPYTN